MATLYPTEASMRAAMTGVIFDPAKEIAETTRMLNTPGIITNQQDRLAAQSYLSSLTGSNTANSTLAANHSYSAPIPGAPDTGPATGGAGANGENKRVELLPKETRDWMESGDTGGPIDEFNAGKWLKEKAGDIGIVVLGVVVVAVALVAASRSNQKMVIEAVKGAVTS